MANKGSAPLYVVRGTITPADSLRAWRHAQQGRFAVIRKLALLSGVLFIAMSAATGKVQFVVLLVGLLIGAMPAWASSIVRRELRKDRKRLHGPHVLTFAEDGITAHRGKRDEYQSWAAFRAFEESQHDLILRVGKKVIVAFPKRLFEPAQLDGVRALMVAKVPTPGGGPTAPR